MRNPSYSPDSLPTIPPASMPARIQAFTGILKTDLDKVFLVGGCVRDILSGRDPEDIDLLAVLPPKRLLDLGFTYVDPKTTIPVFTMHRGDLGKVEIALPRGKGSGSGALSEVREDLRRRDFTINTMACRLSTGELIDPFSGRRDLKDRVIRHVSEAFAEDPLRVFRAFRFACKGFTIAPETMDLIRTMDPELQHIPPERIYNEMMKAMAEERPERFFIYLVKSGVSRDVFREIYRMLDVVAGPPEYHPEGSTFNHAVNVLKFVAGRTRCKYTRLAAFLHDIGKVETPEGELPRHIGHEKRGIEVVQRFLSRLKGDNRCRKVCTEIARHHMKAERFRHMRRGKQMRFVNTLHKMDLIDPLLHVVEADYGKDISPAVAPFREVAGYNTAELGLSPEDFEGKSGEQIQDLILQRQLERLGM
jgi:tRNA nucleotidyltransferase (CCA-adding enzyme)